MKRDTLSTRGKCKDLRDISWGYNTSGLSTLAHSRCQKFVEPSCNFISP